jgi:hypothetical protein
MKSSRTTAVDDTIIGSYEDSTQGAAMKAIVVKTKPRELLA